MKEKMGADCLEIISKKLPPNDMARDQYYNALIELHVKYPMPGHNPALTTFQIRNYGKIKETHKIEQAPKFRDLNLGTVYQDHLQPRNFLEAAEMYKQSLDKRDEECLPLTAWRSKEWPLSRDFKAKPISKKDVVILKDDEDMELQGTEGEEFERKRQLVRERLPYAEEL